MLGDQPAHHGRKHLPLGPSRRPRAGAVCRRTRRLDRLRLRPRLRRQCGLGLGCRRLWRGLGCRRLRLGLRRGCLRLGLGCIRRLPVAGARGLVGDDRQPRPDIDGLALRHQDLGEVTAGRRRHLGVDLVGRDLEQRLVSVDLVADLLEPLRDRALGDGLAELRHGDVGHQPCNPLPVRDSIASPNVSDNVGWGWMNSPTSSGSASQFTAR